VPVRLGRERPGRGYLPRRAELMASIPLTKVKVADQASTVLAGLPYIARRIDRQKIIASVTATWPDPPAPLIYWPHSH